MEKKKTVSELKSFYKPLDHGLARHKFPKSDDGLYANLFMKIFRLAGQS